MIPIVPLEIPVWLTIPRKCKMATDKPKPTQKPKPVVKPQPASGGGPRKPK